jgi:hypothetical protein
MNFTEIIITYYKDSSTFNQIVFISEGIIDFVEPFELKHHHEYLNLEITKFKEIH